MGTTMLQELSEDYSSMRKDTETMRKNPSEMKNTTSDMKNTWQGIKSRLDEAQDQISNLEVRGEKKKNTQWSSKRKKELERMRLYKEAGGGQLEAHQHLYHRRTRGGERERE